MARNDDKLWERALKVIPQGTQTLSKMPSRFVEGIFPKYIKWGSGSKVCAPGGKGSKMYIDWIGALGANLLGYGYFDYREDVKNNMGGGEVYSLPNFLEVDLAEKLVEIIPCAEMCRFAKNGVDATAGAVRLARAITKRDHFISYGYHGYQDLFGCTGTMNDGIPAFNRKLIHEIKWNKIDDLKSKLSLWREVACVIMEVPPEEPKGTYLQDAIDLTHKYGALFILDEIVTGFRYALGGAQELYKVMPDLACFGKAMANGLPISVIVGKREYMEHFFHVFFSTTFGGETLAMATGLAVINEIQTKGIIEHIWQKGLLLRVGIIKLAEKYNINMKMPGNPPRSLINFYDEDNKVSLLIKSLFLQECCLRGVLFGVPVIPTFSHTTEDVDKTLDAVEHAFKVIKKAKGNYERYLKGKIMQGSYVRPKL